jgi:hypothetical protein
MYSKVVARQLEEAKGIALAFGKNAEKAAIALLQRFAASAANPAAATVDWKAVLDTLGQDLLEISGQLAELDTEYQIQLLLEKQGRNRRDAAMEKLRNQLRGARFLLDQAFGKEKASEYFPDRSDLTRVKPRNLAPLGRRIAQVLRGTQVDWPVLDGETHLPKPQELAASLDATAGELDNLLDALVPERGGSVFTRGSKKAEYLATRQAVSSTTAALSGLFRIAGFDYAAKRLGRPRKKGQGEPEGEASPPPAGDPPAAVLPPAA